VTHLRSHYWGLRLICAYVSVPYPFMSLSQYPHPSPQAPHIPVFPHAPVFISSSLSTSFCITILVLLFLSLCPNPYPLDPASNSSPLFSCYYLCVFILVFMSVLHVSIFVSYYCYVSPSLSSCNCYVTPSYPHVTVPCPLPCPHSCSHVSVSMSPVLVLIPLSCTHPCSRPCLCVLILVLMCPCLNVLEFLYPVLCTYIYVPCNIFSLPMHLPTPPARATNLYLLM
jgi:hypothetical protein